MEEDQRGMLYSFLAFGCGGMMRSWIQNGMKKTPEEMSALLLKYAEYIINGVQTGQLP